MRCLLEISACEEKGEEARLGRARRRKSLTKSQPTWHGVRGGQFRTDISYQSFPTVHWTGGALLKPSPLAIHQAITR